MQERDDSQHCWVEWDDEVGGWIGRCREVPNVTFPFLSICNRPLPSKEEALADTEALFGYCFGNVELPPPRSARTTSVVQEAPEASMLAVL